jgi:hypothetical protein
MLPAGTCGRAPRSAGYSGRPTRCTQERLEYAPGRVGKLFPQSARVVPPQGARAAILDLPPKIGIESDAATDLKKGGLEVSVVEERWNVNARGIKLLAVIGGSAAVSAAALGVAIVQGSGDSSAIAGSDMTTGVTVTATLPASAVSIPQAVPGIKGPAPLPPEEQGLPGG